MLSWSTSNATAISIDNGVGSVPEDGSTSTTVSANTTWTLSTVGAVGVATCAASVIVLPPPPPPPPSPTCTLDGSPISIVAGGSSILSWITTNATTFTIDQSIGPVIPVVGGSIMVAPVATTTYSGTAIGPGGVAHCSVQIKVTPPPPPPPGAPTCTLSASPPSIPAGNTSSLSWTTANATTFVINQGVGTSTPVLGGSTTVSPTVTTTYTGTAEGPGGTTTCQTTIIVVPPPPPPLPTCSLSANGDPSLVWTTTNATTFEIDHGIGSVTPVPAGSVAIAPPTVTTTYTGTAEGEGGEATCETTITVIPPPGAVIVKATKIVCENESDLPNWSGTAHTIGASTATDWVASHAGCNLAPDWTFEWANGGATNPGDSVAAGGAGWTSFGPSGANGAATANVLSFTGGKIWVREQFQNGYIPFTGTGGGPISAELYCHTDVVNYDNFDYIESPLGGNTYYCVAWNVPIPPPPPSPTCTLSALPDVLISGNVSELSWQTTNATTLEIDHSIGFVTPVLAGATSTSPLTATTTFIGTAVGPGGSVECEATVAIVPLPPPGAPLCTLSAVPDTVEEGEGTSLSWTTVNAITFFINNGIGTSTPVALGFASTSPLTATTTFIGTAAGLGGEATCEATVAVTPPPPPPPLAPSCTLSASPSTVTPGSTSTLTWTTTNATTFEIDHGIGTSTPVLGGSTTTPAITGDTTFAGTVVGPGGTASCAASVTVTTGGGGGGPSCALTISPQSIGVYDSATLTWGGSNLQSVFIDNGVGTTTSVTGSTQISRDTGSYTYTGTFTAVGGQTLSCSATLTVTSGGGGCVTNCGGGGGGGGSPPPNIVLSALPRTTAAPLAFLYLSQIPYTGIELGPVGTVIYWIALVLWSIAVAYLVLFGVVPFILRKARAFGAQVAEVVNATQTPRVATVPAGPIFFAQESEPGYSTYEGFKSFAKRNGALTIEDIVKGLSRERSKVEAIHDRVEPIFDRVEPVYENVEPIMTELEERPESMAGAPSDVRGFIAALVEGDRGAVFAALRLQVKSGASPEAFVTKIACAIDDAFRSRIDGTPADPEIVRVTARLDTGTLEKLVSALSNAIDSSYSLGITGAKLALTRALSALGA